MNKGVKIIVNWSEIGHLLWGRLEAQSVWLPVSFCQDSRFCVWR